MRAALIGAALALAAGAARANESPTAFFLHNLPATPHSGTPAVPAAAAQTPALPRRKSPSEQLREVPGSPTVPQLVAEAARWIGSGNPTGKPGAWCAWFVSFVLQRTGHRPLASGMAASALAYGPRLAAPRAGALALMARGGVVHHVGIVESVDGGRVTMVSGNWSRRVSRAVLPRTAFAAFIGVER